MERKWCWRCEMEIPMLDKEELQLCIEAREKGKPFVLEEIRKRNLKNFEWLEDKLYGHDRLRYFVEMYRVITGFMEENNPNAIWHHCLSEHDLDCPQCLKPLRTNEARYCVNCGFGKEDLKKDSLPLIIRKKEYFEK